MKRCLLDSNAVTSMINNRKPFLLRLEEARRRGVRIGTCEPVVAELHFGLELSASRDVNLVRLRRALKLLTCWPFDRGASETYGRLAADLRRRGRPMQTIDIMLAAIALSLGDCTVISTDSDLKFIPGLALENWEIVQQTP